MSDKICLELLVDKGSAKKGYIGLYGKEEANRLIDSGKAKKHVEPRPSRKKKEIIETTEEV